MIWYRPKREGSSDEDIDNEIWLEHTAERPANQWLVRGGWPSPRTTASYLLRTVLLRPFDKYPGDGSSKCVASLIVHRKVDATPDARIAGFLPDRSDVIGARR